VYLQAKIHDVFFADLQIVGDVLSVDDFAPAAFVETKFRVDQVAMILDEPGNAVEWASPLFVGGEGDDDVAVRNEALFFELDEVGEPDGGLRLVIPGTAAVKVAVFFVELERIHAPVFALGFDDVYVREEKKRLAFAGAVIVNDDIFFLGTGAAEEDIGIGKASGSEASCSGFGHGSGRTGSEAGLNFDELFVDVVSESLFGVRAGGLGEGGGGGKRGQEQRS
jgi:hypothetical protein